MRFSMRSKILKLLEEKKESLTSEEIAKRLGYNQRQIQEANTNLLKQKRIKKSGGHPWKYSFNTDKDDSSSEPVVKKSAPIKVSKSEELFYFNDYMILYVTEGNTPKLLQEFNSPEDLIAKFEELQELPDLVSIAAYKKLETAQKVEIKF